MPAILPAFGGDTHHSHPGKSINPPVSVCPHGTQWNSLSVLLMTSFRLLKILYTEEQMSKHMVVSTRDSTVGIESIAYNTIPHHTTPCHTMNSIHAAIIYQSYHTMLYHTIPYHFTYHTMSYHISWIIHNISYHTMPYHIIYTIPCHLTSSHLP